MSEPLQIQIALNKTPERIFQALTEELPDWFAEFADVRLADHQYDFWGRFTPDAPARDAGKHPLTSVLAGQELRFDWQLNGEPTQVLLRLIPQNGGTLLALRHEGVITIEDFWFLSLENLRRHVDGKLPVRCDYSTLPSTGDVQHTVEIDAPASVIFEALINPEQLNRWFASHAKIDARVGGELDLGWTGFGAMKILELVPNEKIAFASPSEGDNPPTVLTWTLEGSGGKTRLTLVHSGFAPDAPTAGIQSGWLNFASWLKSLAEYGDDWKPAIKQLTPELEPFYPGSMAIDQTSWDAVQQSV